MAARLYMAVAAGSAIGAVSRYLVSVGLLSALGPAFPWGTLAANVMGSFLIGLYAALSRPGGRLPASVTMHVFVLAGFCGGFTTFSIFSLETLILLERQNFALASANVAGSLGLWLAAVWIGFRFGTRVNRSKKSVSVAGR